MFVDGFTKQATVGEPPKPRVDPVTARDAEGASKKAFKPIGSPFGSGHKPHEGIKPLSGVQRVN